VSYGTLSGEFDLSCTRVDPSVSRWATPAPAMDETEASWGTRSADASLSLLSVAVAQSPGEPAGSVLRPGSENGQVVRHTPAAARHGGRLSISGTHFRERAAPLPRRLYATATSKSSAPTLGSCFVVHSERLAGTGGRTRIRGIAVEARKGSACATRPRAACSVPRRSLARRRRVLRDRRVSSSRAPPVHGRPRAASADALR
jgi:hypothetical protein